MNDMLIRIRQKAALLHAALASEQEARTKHHQAWARWNAEPIHTQEANHAIVTTEEMLDVTRDAVIAKASNLLDTVHIFLRLNPPREYAQLALQAASMQDSLDRETVAFTAYTKSTGLFNTKAHENWATAKDACAQAAFHLMFEASRMPFQPDATPPCSIPESQIPTDLEGTPDWKSAATPEERDRILYENRKKTLGSKRAGQLTYAIPRAIAKRQGQSSNSSTEEGDL